MQIRPAESEIKDMAKEEISAWLGSIVLVGQEHFRGSLDLVRLSSTVVPRKDETLYTAKHWEGSFSHDNIYLADSAMLGQKRNISSQHGIQIHDTTLCQQASTGYPQIGKKLHCFISYFQ